MTGVVVFCLFIIATTIGGVLFVRWSVLHCLPVSDGPLKLVRFLFWWATAVAISCALVASFALLASMLIFWSALLDLEHGESLMQLSLLPVGLPYVWGLVLGWRLQFAQGAIGGSENA